MTRHLPSRIAALLLGQIPAISSSSSIAEEPPNIAFILADNTVLIFTSDNGGVEYTDPPATDNHPFKGGKACLHEGGVRLPTIIWQPGRFEGGQWCDAVIDATDFLPTIAELTGNTAPDDIDGMSIVPRLESPASPGPERTLIWHDPFNVIVRHPDHGEPLAPHSAIPFPFKDLR